MSALLMSWALTASHVMLAMAMLLVTWRIFRGPRAQDRVLALDALYMNAMLLLLTFGIRYGTRFYFDAALVIGLLGFTATVALAKFLLRGEVIE